jgi:perosamine synthetase
MIPIYKPYLKNYKQSAIKCINDEWISNHGIFVKLAADKLCDITGIEYCILMNNGTSATQCLYKALKFKYPNVNKIYVPNNVFIAPINCGLMEFGMDSFEIMKMNPNTLNIDTSEEYIRTLEKNSCVMIVHNLGNIVNVPRLKKIRPDIIFIEDNCEGLFGTYDGKFSGSESLCSSISFYGNKTVTTGEGGAFLTNDPEIYKFIKVIYSHGMSEKRYVHNLLGYNFRMTNIEAGFLYDQLCDYTHILSLKKKIFDNYDLLLSELIKKKLVLKTEPESNTQISYWMYVILIPDINYDRLETFMEQKNIQIRPIFYDLHTHQHLQQMKKTLEQPFTHKVSQYGVMIPSYPELSPEEQKYITSCIGEYIQTYMT